MNGGLVASNANISGHINASSGSFTGTITAATINGSEINGSTISSSTDIYNRIVIIPPDISDTTGEIHSIRFISLPGEDFNQSPSIRAKDGNLFISGGDNFPLRDIDGVTYQPNSSRLQFNSFPGGIRLLGDNTYMQQTSTVGLGLKNGKGVFRNISYGSTPPSGANNGDIHFSLV